VPTPGVYLEDLCFDAQQAAEKAVKALLIHRGVEFPFVHDLARLLTLLEESGLDVPQDVRAAETLTPYAAITCYPTLFEPVTDRQYREAVELAQGVIEWARSHLQAET
jgi:HEPN domain-containing protein